jgi:hypothetical protein
MSMNRDLKGWVSADEVVDTKPLFEEIRKLSEENQQLRASLTDQEKRLSKKGYAKESFQDLRNVLEAITVKVPANLTSEGKEMERDLLTLFYNTKEDIVNGVTNAHDASDYDAFLYFSMCPKLQVHGLTINEKVTGVRYRRYAITPLGSAFLADMDRTFPLPKIDPATPPPSDKPATVQTKGKATKVAKKAAVPPSKRKS